MDGCDGALVEVDDQPRRGREVVQDALETPNPVQLGTHDDDGVISVLEEGDPSAASQVGVIP